MYNAPYVTSPRPQPHIPAILNKWAGLWKNNSFKEHLKDYYSLWYLPMSYINSGTTGTGKEKKKGGEKTQSSKYQHTELSQLHCVFSFKTYYSICDAAKIMTKHHKPLSIWPKIKYFLPDLQNDICRFLKNQFKLLSYKEGGVRKKEALKTARKFNSYWRGNLIIPVFLCLAMKTEDIWQMKVQFFSSIIWCAASLPPLYSKHSSSFCHLNKWIEGWGTLPC